MSRVLAATIEQNYDKNGIIFPWHIAPFQIAVLYLKKDFEEEAEKIYRNLSQKWDVILDDRDERPGVKFKDIDLIGIPLQIIFGKSYEKNKEVEVKIRKTGERKYLKPENLENFVNEFENEKD